MCRILVDCWEFRCGSKYRFRSHQQEITQDMEVNKIFQEHMEGVSHGLSAAVSSFGPDLCFFLKLGILYVGMGLVPYSCNFDYLPED